MDESAAITIVGEISDDAIAALATLLLSAAAETDEPDESHDESNAASAAPHTRIATAGV